MKYLEILNFNSSKKNKKNKSLKINIMSNIVCYPLKDYLKYFFNKKNIETKISFSEYGNFNQPNKKNFDIHVIFFEFLNIYEGIQYEIDFLDEKKLKEIIKSTKLKIDLMLNNIEKNKTIIINKLFDPFSNSNSIDFYKEIFLNEINSYISSYSHRNIHFIDIGRIILRSGMSKTISKRDFYLSKNLYKFKFYENYSKNIVDSFVDQNKINKKVLILDCDNTLWDGIILENGINNLKMNKFTFPGSVFYEVQKRIDYLYRCGVILCLCTKNNLSDLKKVFLSKTLLKLNQFASIKANWRDKYSNILEISKELNLGLDSFVFVDDSEYEISSIKKKLPKVKTYKVPSKNLVEYLNIFKKIEQNFKTKNLTNEDRKKNLYYKLNKDRNKFKETQTNEKNYIKNLRMKIKIIKNDKRNIDRISELTKKTNQFNNSLKRYDVKAIQNFMSVKSCSVFSMSLNDKFGENGLTSLIIANFSKLNKNCIIDTYLISCRIFGRNIENVFLNKIENHLIKIGLKYLIIPFNLGPRNKNFEKFAINYGFKKKKKQKKIFFTKDLEKYPEKKFQELNIKFS